jgi:hypothetical protein
MKAIWWNRRCRNWEQLPASAATWTLSATQPLRAHTVNPGAVGPRHVMRGGARCWSGRAGGALQRATHYAWRNPIINCEVVEGPGAISSTPLWRIGAPRSIRRRHQRARRPDTRSRRPATKLASSIAAKFMFGVSAPRPRLNVHWRPCCSLALRSWSRRALHRLTLWSEQWVNSATQSGSHQPLGPVDRADDGLSFGGHGWRFMLFRRSGFLQSWLGALSLRGPWLRARAARAAVRDAASPTR